MLIVLSIFIFSFILVFIKDIYEYIFNIDRCDKSKNIFKSHHYKQYRKPLTWEELTHNIGLMSSGISGRSYIWRKKENPIIGEKCEHCNKIKLYE